jgi:hypothetical protein
MTTYRLAMLLAAQMLACHGADAAAQKVFRCGPDGRIYSQTPCKDGYEAKDAAAAQGTAASANPSAAKPAASAAPGASASAGSRKPEPKKPQPAQP